MARKLRKYLIEVIIVILIYTFVSYSFLYLNGLVYKDLNVFMLFDLNFFPDKKEYSMMDRYGVIKLSVYKDIKNDKDASRVKADIFSYIDGQYEERDSPYPGQISNQIKCEKNYLPKKTSTELNNTVYTLFSNDRYSYGICDEESVYYKSIIKFMYCKKLNKALLVEYFIKRNINVDLNYLSSRFLCAN